MLSAASMTICSGTVVRLCCMLSQAVCNTVYLLLLYILNRNTETCLDDIPAHIIHGHRFMHHKLLAVARDKLLPGGFFVWATFMQVN
jgi:hypothetical protein